MIAAQASINKPFMFARSACAKPVVDLVSSKQSVSGMWQIDVIRLSRSGITASMRVTRGRAARPGVTHEDGAPRSRVWTARRLASGAAVLALATCSGGPTGGVAPGNGPNPAPDPLVDTEHVSPAGSYQTAFDIPVPPAPASPRLALTYDSHSAGTLAGVGWDLSVGWPMSIVRDVRFGTPQWTMAADWVWGSSPLVRSNPDDAECRQGRCKYRMAPDTLVDIEIDLLVPFPEDGQPLATEHATIHLPDGTTLEYEPIHYDGINLPLPPAGAVTGVFGFRLASASDRNGYLSCFKYADAQDPEWGRVAPLKEVAYGRPPSPSMSCAALLSDPTRHAVKFKYDDISYNEARHTGFFRSWTLKFGAPASFTSLLRRITVIAAGTEQDAFTLEYEGQESETHRPRLAAIVQRVAGPAATPIERTVRTFGYGTRTPRFGGPLGTPEILELGAVDDFPASLAGSVARPMRRPKLFGNPLGVTQLGRDVATDAAPQTHATTEQWQLVDLNGDRLPDFQWGREVGFDTTNPWPTYEGGLGGAVGTRPAQQQVLINEGIAGSRLATTRLRVDSHAGEFEVDSLELQYKQGFLDPDAAPVSPPIDGFTPWFWGEGNGTLRTGLPVAVSAAEIPRPAPECPPREKFDSRRWPIYPDGTYKGPRGSTAALLADLRLTQPGEDMNLGNPVLSIISGVRDGYHPYYSVQSAVSGWTDLDGDGIPEFVATPAWIERFSIDPGCRYTQSISGFFFPAQIGEREAFAAATGRRATGYTIDTDWHAATFDGTPALWLKRQQGPKGPRGLPLSFEVSAGGMERGPAVTLPIASSIQAGISTIWSGWMGIAAAGPGLTVSAMSPRAATGGSLSISMPTPSFSNFLQSVGTTAASGNVSGGDFVSMLMSVVNVNVNYDVTVVARKSHNRSESLAQLVDLNADGLPDYLLYNTGNGIVTGTTPGGQPITAPPGSLLAFMNTPAGFDDAADPVVINQGFDYTNAPPAAEFVESRLVGTRADGTDGIRVPAGLLGHPLTSQQCVLAAPTCYAYLGLMWDVIAKSRAIETDPALAAFMTATTDALPSELDQWSDVAALNAFLTNMAGRPGVPPTGVIPQRLAAFLLGVPFVIPPTPVEIDSMTWAANTVSTILGHVARTLRHLARPSRINVVSQGFSELDESDVVNKPWADGIAAQTRGFVDLNGDTLPDYVVSNHREGPCAQGQWEVFWGTGTSSISAGRAFLPTASLPSANCVNVPDASGYLVSRGYPTIPLSVDVLRRDPVPVGVVQDVTVHANAYVTLADFNRDGRPDLIIVTEGGRCPARQPWQVHLNHGTGFDKTPSLCLPSPGAALPDVSPASSRATGLNVSHPLVRTMHTAVSPERSRNTTDTHAALIDLDGDGAPEVLRRVTLTKDDGTTRAGLLVWRRGDDGAPQDLMSEERHPLEGRRLLIRYESASSFQWTDALPTGGPPQLGHGTLVGLPSHLVRSVTNERLIGRADRRTRHGYDYKRPVFDMSTRTWTGFAVRSSAPLDASPDDPAAAVALPASLTTTRRDAQRPHGLPGLTHTRKTITQNGAPVVESLVSYAESSPTITGRGAGELTPIFSAPTRSLTVEYPEGLTRGPVFDVGFDGREPLRDRAASRTPVPASSDVASSRWLPHAATGGALAFASNGTPLTYPSPHAGVSASASLTQATIEAWVKPLAPAEGQVIVEQTAGYRLAIAAATNGWRWQVDVGGAPLVASDTATALVVGEWHHVVASFGQGGARLFVNGVLAGSAPPNTPIALQPSGAFVVGCGAPASSRCFAGEIGELRVYPEEWRSAPRVSDIETLLNLPPGCAFDEQPATPACPHDFGQPLQALKRFDLSTQDDDVAEKYEYARPATAARLRIRGVVAAESSHPLDGTRLGEYLRYTEHRYDGLPLGEVAAGNETERSQYAGMPQMARPTLAQLTVRTRTEYSAGCPGRPVTVIDPRDSRTITTWDERCAVQMSVTNALGHSLRTVYYGIDASTWLSATVPASFGSYQLRGRYGQVAVTIDPNDAGTTMTHDPWGRVSAVWSPLDRRDRPGLRLEYEDALCEYSPGYVGLNNLSGNLAACGDRAAEMLKAPARIATFTWDDQGRRCRNARGEIAACSDPTARTFADEQSAGAYLVSYAFSDGQRQNQGVASGEPAWTVDGIVDFDAQGRAVRAYKTRHLPQRSSLLTSACPAAGTWCDSSRLPGDPLRDDVATAQFAYDARGRRVRVYGPGVPRCAGDPSTLDPATGEPACDTLVPQAPKGDVTRFSYPSPGATRATDAHGIPVLVQEDARGLTTRVQEYSTPSPGAAGTPVTQPVEYSATRLTYDRMGRLHSTEDQDGNRWLNVFDAMSRLISSDDPDLGRTTLEYDADSRLRQRIVASGEMTRHFYDAIGRVIQTDYLRPIRDRSPPGSTPPAGTTDPPPLPEFCHDVPGFTDPTRFVPRALAVPAAPLAPLALARGSLADGEAGLELPFDVRIRTTTAARMDGTDAAAVQSTARDFLLPAGTYLSISTDARVGIESRASPGVARGPVRQPIAGTFDVLGADLTLDKDGLRYGVAGERGSRSLTIEWTGTLANNTTAPVRVRATFDEAGPGVRYDYERVPPGLPGGSIQIADDAGGFDVRLPFSEDSNVAPALGDGVTFELAGRGLGNRRVSCTRDPGAVTITRLPLQSTDDTLRLGVRVFSDCPNGATRCVGHLRVGYRASGSSTLAPLAMVAYAQRPLAAAGDLARSPADEFSVPIAEALRGTKIELVFERQLSSADSTRPAIIDVLLTEGRGVEYEVEERVHRTYDSSEPSYYLAGKPGTNPVEFAETLPTADFSFDVPRRAVQTSTGGAELRCRRFIGGVLQESDVVVPPVVGASGRGVELTGDASSGTECDVTGLSGTPGAFTTEFWVRPTAAATREQDLWRAPASATEDFVVQLLPPAGTLRCGLSGGRWSATDVPLPVDGWSHVAMTYDGTNLRCTVNGARHGLSASTTAPGLRLASPPRIGDRQGSLTVAFDELRVMAAPRSAREILDDALRPLDPGGPRGNLLHLGFGDPNRPGEDESKAANHAMFTGQAATGNPTPRAGGLVPGIQGTALDTGKGEQLTVRDAAPDRPLRLANQVTAELWVKPGMLPSAAPERNRLIGKWHDHTVPGWRLDLEQPSRRLRWEVVTAEQRNGRVLVRHEAFVTFESLREDRWQHVAATYDGQRLRVFIDGIPAHRWCGSGVQEGEPPIGAACTDPPAPEACAVETASVEVPGGRATLGDAGCVTGTIDNTEPVMIARDAQSPGFAGLLDEVRLSNYAKREFEIAMSARLSSAFTQALGRETMVRNRLPVAPAHPGLPAAFDLADLVARPRRAFDLQGRIVTEWKYVRGQRSPANRFLVRVAPDSSGRDGLVEYPHGEVVVGQFEHDGTQASLIGYGPGISNDPSQAQTYIADAASTVTGRRAAIRFGNGVATSFTYDDGPLQAPFLSGASGTFGADLLKTATVRAPGGALLSERRYGWDAVGNLKTLDDFARDAQGRVRATAVYDYDDLRRVISATITVAGQSATASYRYDPLGNLILHEGATQDYGAAFRASQCAAVPQAPGSAQPHAVMRRTPSATGAVGDPYCYDAAGRLVSSVDSAGNNIRRLTYFARGKLHTLSDRRGPPAHEYAYDGNGVRVRKSEVDDAGGRRTTTRWSPLFSEEFDPTVAGAPQFEAVYFGADGAVVARRTIFSGGARMRAGPPMWHSLDHLGGTYFLTDLAGNEVAGSRAYHRPYGGLVGAPGQPLRAGRFQFTGKEQDASGLYDFGARIYDPTTGRFTQPDLIDVGPRPQALNRYAYVMNNPLNQIDPTGRDGILVHDLADGTVTLRIPVKFEGTDATPKKIAEIVDSTSQLQLPPGFRVEIIPTNTPIDGVLNTLDLSPRRDRSLDWLIACNRSPGCASSTSAHVDSDNLYYVSASVHEILHMGGMEDRYNRFTLETDPGYEGNLMAGAPNPKLKEAQFYEGLGGTLFRTHPKIVTPTFSLPDGGTGTMALTPPGVPGGGTAQSAAPAPTPQVDDDVVIEVSEPVIRPLGSRQ